MVRRRVHSGQLSSDRDTTIQIGLRYEYMSPLRDIRYPNSNLTFVSGVPQVFVGGQQGYPVGLMFPNKLNFAPRFGISHHIPGTGWSCMRLMEFSLLQLI